MPGAPDLDLLPADLPRTGRYCWDPVQGTLALTDGAAALLGRPGAAPACAEIEACIYAADRAELRDSTRVLLKSGGDYQRQFRVLRADGEIRQLLDTGLVERDASGRATAFRGMLVDVTGLEGPRAATEGELARSEARLLRSNAAAGVGVYEYEARQSQSYWSPQLLSLIGREREAQAGELNIAISFVHPEEREEVEAQFRTILERVGPYEMEYRILRPDGSVIWVHDKGETFGPDPDGPAQRCAGVLIDITRRKTAELALSRVESSQRIQLAELRAIYNAAPIGLALFDRDFRYVRVNSRLARINGLDRVEHEGRMLEEVVSKATAKALRGIQQRLLAGEEVSNLHLVADPDEDGVVREWQVSYRPLRNTRGEVTHFLGAVNEVTEQARSERALAEANAQLQAVFDAAPVGIGVWDRDLRFVRINEMLASLNGLPPAAHIGRRPDELLPDLAGIDRLMEDWRRIIETGEPLLDVEVKGKTPAEPGVTRYWLEHFFPVRVGGEVIGLGAIIEETTGRRLAESAERRATEMLREIMDNARAFIILFETDGRIVHINRMALRTTQMPAEDIIGRRLWDAPVWTRDPDVGKRLRRAITRAGRGRTVRYDERLRLAEGGTVWIDVTLSPLRNSAGEVVRIIGSAFDISGRKEAEDRINMLLAEVNHRSKNMLALVQSIARQTVLTSPEDFLDRFVQRVAAISAAQDLLVTSGWRSVQMEELARSQLAHYADLLGTRIRLSGPPTALPAEVAQPLAITLHELATNAAKYGALSNAEGCVDLSWSVSTGADGGPRMAVEWREQDGPPVSPPTRRGFGTTVTEAMAASALQGEVSLEFLPEGTRWRLKDAPIGPPVEATPEMPGAL